MTSSQPATNANLDDLFLRFRRAGDVDALGALFDRCAPELARVAGNLCRDRTEVEELVQRTFVTAIESADRYDPRLPVTPWLLGILIHKWKDLARLRAREIDAKRLHTTEPDDPAKLAQRNELSTLVRDTLRRLPEKYREVLSMHLLSDQRSVDIARRLGRPAGTVRMQLSRGLDLLRQALPAGVSGSVAVLGPPELGGVRAQVLAAAASKGSGWTVLSAGWGIRAVLVAGVIGLSAAVWTRTREEAPPAPPVSATAPDLSTSDEELDLGVAEDAPVSVVRQPVADERFELLVREAETGIPVPEARIELQRPGRTTALESFSDLQGLASVPAWTGDATVVVQAPGRYGTDSLSSRDVLVDATQTTPRLEIWLRRDLQATVEVRDATGRPVAGVPISVEPAPRGSSISFDLDLPRTDAEGRVVLEHIQEEFRFRREIRALSFQVAAAVPSLSFQERSVDDLERPVAFVLPAHGVVEVELPDQDDDRGFHVRLRGSAPQSPILSGSPPMIRAGGLARFEPVEVGVPFDLHVYPNGRMPPALRSVAVEAAGQVVRVELDHLPADERLRFRGRLLDVDGRPVADRRIRSRLNVVGSNTGFGCELRLETDDQGRFSHREDTAVPVGSEVSLRFLLPGGPRRQLPSARRRFVVEDHQAIDLGEVRFEAPRPVVKGVVLLPDGRPAAGARVYFRGAQLPGQVSIPVEEDGSFAWYRLEDPGTFTATAFLDGWQSADVEGSTSDRDLRLVLGELSTISGRVVSARAEVFEWLHVLVDPTGPGGGRRLSLDGEGRFFTSGMEGELSLRVQDRWHATALVRIPLTVAEGQQVVVPDIPVDHQVRMIDLRVQHHDGGAPDHVFLRAGDHRPTRSIFQEYRLELDQGRAPLLVREDVPVFRLRDPRRRWTQVEPHGAEHQVVLRPMLPITVRLPLELPALEGEERYLARLVPAAAARPLATRHATARPAEPARDPLHNTPTGGPWIRLQPAELATLPLLAPDAGLFRLQIALNEGQDPELHSTWTDLALPILEVLDVDETQELRLSEPPDLGRIEKIVLQWRALQPDR